MAPPSNKPKLTSLTPEAVALEVATLACEHAARYVMALLTPAYSLRAEPRRQPEALSREAQVYSTVLDLASYAIHGSALDAPVEEYLISLLPLWSSATGDHVDVDGLRAEADPESALGLVICASVAREALGHGKSVTAAQLAVLAGLSATQVRQLARQGELELEGGVIAAKDARRWLAARHVPGFTRAR